MRGSKMLGRLGSKATKILVQGDFVQIDRVAGDLTVITSNVGHSPSTENCNACPVRCCSHRGRSIAYRDEILKNV